MKDLNPEDFGFYYVNNKNIIKEEIKNIEELLSNINPTGGKVIEGTAIEVNNSGFRMIEGK